MSKLDGVDISGFDKGIDVRSLSAAFVIVKATEGTQGTVYNPSYRAMADAALDSGKLLGFYHYANGGDPTAEADSFYEAIKDYRGRAIATLDWEKLGNPKFGGSGDVTWCKRFLDRISERFGGTPMLYTSKGVCNSYDWSSVASKYPLWGAEYAYEDYVYQGYESNPWQSKVKWGAWGAMPTIFQYGYVNPKPNNGGKSSLDADAFYGTRDDWQRFCGEKGATVGKVLVRINDKAATIHHAMCKDERNGYSQYPDRWGGDYGSKPTTAKVSTRWWTVEYLLGSFDCSSSTILSWRLALVGTKYEGVLDDATCTSDMMDVFLKSGLFTASLTPAKRGDLYLTPGKHVAMCQDGGNDGVFGADILSEFNRNENHGAYNGKPGDQDGLESVVKPYYNFPWVTVLHYNGKADYYVEDSKPAPTPAKQKVKAVTRGVYRVYDAGNSRHHWTSDAAEAQKLVDSGWKYEGVAWKSSITGSKVYRAYNPKNGDHLLCTNAARMLDALGKGWRYEGVAFLAGGKKPVYELYDSGHKEHFYTASLDERNTCKGWMTDKGIGFYV